MKTAWICIAFGIAFAASVAAAVVIDRSGKAPVVRVERNGKTVFEHPFGAGHQIYAAEESPSGCYLLVWHMDRSPRRLTIYRLTDNAEVSDFVPGYGGDLQWTRGDKILHEWGAGTGVKNICVYDVTGAVVHSDSVTGAILTDRGYYLVFPTTDVAADKSLSKYDVNDGKKTVLRSCLPGIPKDYAFHEGRLTLRFASGEPLEVATDDR